MPNKLAVAAARSGSESFHQWRLSESAEICDLSNADLRGAELRWTNLAGSILDGADLSDADLTGAYFGPSTFSDFAPFVKMRNVPVSVQRTRFDRAKLVAATFNFPEISDASFAGAHLGLTTFRRAALTRVDFSESRMTNTAFLACDMSRSKGLETVRHHGPSHIDHDTIRLSPGLSNSFLRQSGIPDLVLDYLPDLYSGQNPISFHSCFLSHATSDKEFCDRLYERLVAGGVRTWYAPEDVRGGETLISQLKTAINVFDKLILVLSEQSVSSNWVSNELRWAIQRESKGNRQILFPISIAPFDMIKNWELVDSDTGLDVAQKIRGYFIPDFCDWKSSHKFESAVARLLRDLRASEASASNDG